MKILFSPSESKINLQTKELISQDSFIFNELFQKRRYVINLYNEFVKNATDDELCKIFGLKQYDKNLRQDIFKKGCIKAIQRYNGVAYSHLKYDTLDVKSQEYIDKNVLIFSNLFGAVLASDKVPDYKFKQGEKIGKFELERYYKDNFSNAIDNFLKDELILDLRAEFYNKFYEIKQEFFTFKFVKNSKIVSHYAKAYRGIVLKEMAIGQISSKDELINVKIDGLKLKDIKKIGLKNELLFEIFV